MSVRPKGSARPLASRVNGRSQRQKTLKSPIGCTGVGLHSGKKVSMTLLPAKAGTGIVLRRTDIGSTGAEIALDWRNVVDTRMATTVANTEGVSVGTVEHLMAALAGCEIDNAVIEIDGPEIPVMDGSAAPFVFLIECAGTTTQRAKRRAIEILKPVTVSDDKRSISIVPSDSFSVSFQIDFETAAIARQEFGAELVNGTFKTDIARARTFGFVEDIAKLRAAGLAQGGSMDNAVVIEGNRVLNAEGLRYDDEFVRHKVLDCIGDLYLAGAPILGHVDCLCSGHTLNHCLLEGLFTDETAWRWVDAPVIDHAATAPRRGGVSVPLAAQVATA